MFRSFLLAMAGTCLWASIGAEGIQPLDLADDLYEAASYDAAITEYRRHLFFSADDGRTAEIYRKIGLCYRNMGDGVQGAAMLHAAVDRQENDSLRAVYYVDLSVTHIATGNYAAAELRLLRISSFTTFPNIRQRALFLLLVTYMYQNKWQACEKAADSAMALFGDTTVTSSILSKLNSRLKSTKSPSSAKWLSTFVPGLGQLYAGHPFQALNAAALNSFFGYFLWERFTSDGNVLDALFWFMAFHRFWSGNRNKAASLVRKDVEEKDQKTRAEVLHFLDSLLNQTSDSHTAQ